MAEALGSIGGYALVSKLGQGGMGAVFKATHPSYPGRAFALKVILDEAPDPDSVVRFRREMETLAKASLHPGIVRIFGGTVDGKRPFFVMELAEGRPLQDLAKGAPLEPARAARIVRAIADAVAHLHRQGIIHRDLKPQNVVIGPDDSPKILDFGLVKIAGASRLTKTGASLGTPAYSAPEQLDGSAKDARPVADVYALGGILHFALTGRDPFEGDGSSVSLLKKVLTDPATPPSWAQRGVPAELDAVCLRALEKNAAARYESAQALRDDLARFVAGEPVTVRLPGARERALRWARRHRAKAAALVFAVGVLAAGVLVGGLLTFREARTRGLLLRIEAARAHAREGAPSADVLAATKNLAKQLEDPAFAPVRAELARALDETRALLVRALEGEARRKLEGGHARLERSELDALVAAAREAPRAASLVGEDAGAGFSLGDALLEAREPELVAAAADLARLRPGEPAGLALRAYASLAKRGAPTRLLGPGRPGGDLAGTEREDLAAVARAGGPVGARAAWLLADLLVCRGDPGLGAALEAARPLAASLGDDDKARAAALEKLAASPTTAGLLDELEQGPASSASAWGPQLLERFFVRAGAPSFLEHSELAAEAGTKAEAGTRGEAAALEAAVAQDPPGAFARVKADAAALARIAEVGELAGVAGDSIDPDKERNPENVERNLDKARTALREVLARAPRWPIALRTAARAARDGSDGSLSLASAVLWVLATPTEGEDDYELARRWNRLDRKRLVAVDADPDVKRLGLRIATPPPSLARWDGPDGLAPLAAAEAFDARVEEDVAREELIKTAVASGLPGESVDRAKAAVKGLFRIELLAEAEGAEPALPGSVRAPLVLGAARGLEALRELGGPTVLPYRIRLRRLAYPGPLGGVLARLDVFRLGHLPAFMGDPKPWLDGQGVLPKVARSLVLGAVAAAELEKAEPFDLTRRLYRFAVARAREEAHAVCVGNATGFEKNFRAQIDEIATGFKAMAPLFLVVGENQIELDCHLTLDDERRLAKKAYVYVPPPSWISRERAAGGK